MSRHRQHTSHRKEPNPADNRGSRFTRALASLAMGGGSVSKHRQTTHIHRAELSKAERNNKLALRNFVAKTALVAVTASATLTAGVMVEHKLPKPVANSRTSTLGDRIIASERRVSPLETKARQEGVRLAAELDQDKTVRGKKFDGNIALRGIEGEPQQPYHDPIILGKGDGDKAVYIGMPGINREGHVTLTPVLANAKDAVFISADQLGLQTTAHTGAANADFMANGAAQQINPNDYVVQAYMALGFDVTDPDHPVLQIQEVTEHSDPIPDVLMGSDVTILGSVATSPVRGQGDTMDTAVFPGKHSQQSV